MEGFGTEAGLCCVAHGAGRRMARSEAYAKLRARHTRASLQRSALGARVICDDTTLMYEEHPDAYKPIEPIIESLEQAGSARRLAALVPLVTIKRQ
jgi:release factor H-coupled RctB family protein